MCEGIETKKKNWLFSINSRSCLYLFHFHPIFPSSLLVGAKITLFCLAFCYWPLIGPRTMSYRRFFVLVQFCVHFFGNSISQMTYLGSECLSSPSKKSLTMWWNRFFIPRNLSILLFMSSSKDILTLLENQNRINT